MKVGTGIFTYKEKCQDCKSKTLVDINGFCKDCYIEDVSKEMDKEDYNYIDYCESCNKQIEQIDLGDGSFGCPLCKSDNHIILFEKEVKK